MESCTCTVDPPGGTVYDLESDCPIHRPVIVKGGKTGHDVVKIFSGCTCEVFVTTDPVRNAVNVKMVYVDPDCPNDHPVGLDCGWS